METVNGSDRMIDNLSYYEIEKIFRDIRKVVDEFGIDKNAPIINLWEMRLTIFPDEYKSIAPNVMIEVELQNDFAPPFIQTFVISDIPFHKKIRGNEF